MCSSQFCIFFWVLKSFENWIKNIDKTWNYIRFFFSSMKSQPFFCLLLNIPPANHVECLLPSLVRISDKHFLFWRDAGLTQAHELQCDAVFLINRVLFVISFSPLVFYRLCTCACEQILKKDVPPNGAILKTTSLKNRRSCQRGYLHKCRACLVSRGLVMPLGSKKLRSPFYLGPHAPEWKMGVYKSWSTWDVHTHGQQGCHTASRAAYNKTCVLWCLVCSQMFT